MSSTSLWEINKNWGGKEFAEYKNSWLFCPQVWDILMCKYIRPDERRAEFTGKEISIYMSWVRPWNKETANSRHAKLNDRLNNSSIQYDRVLWELSNLSVFNAKDKCFVADCIDAFVENNINGNPVYANADHIKERFREIAEDIRNLPRRVKYFVIHGTDCDDNVERWFRNKRLSSWENFICEFTLIENEQVVGFATNLDLCKGEKEYEKV